MTRVYRNSTEVGELHGFPVYMNDIVDACLAGKLNLFLQGDTGSGKTQLARDMMSYFPEKSLFILGRNDMDTRELFQQINPEFFDAVRKGKNIQGLEAKQLTDAVHYNLIVVDELPNCVPAVRAQLFNLFDGFIEINGKPYPIGNGYSVGIGTGNIGQQFTESSNELGRALKDRMHVILDVDYFFPKPSDTLEILASSTNPRVEFNTNENEGRQFIKENQELAEKPVSLEKLIIANYLLHGLDYCNQGQSKREMKSAWPNQVTAHGAGSDEALVLPASPRAAKSIIRLSQALDEIAKRKGATEEDIESGSLNSMMMAYKLVSAYSGILNEAMVQNVYNGNHYSALNAAITATKGEFDRNKDKIMAGLEMVKSMKRDDKTISRFAGRWKFMRNTLDYLLDKQKREEKK
ncbi:AAA family ATPase [Candidatus Pacearchaeota archaeon]|nr:AAA family ATPase [Candidatus Pacearchaeota archaeon]